MNKPAGDSRYFILLNSYFIIMTIGPEAIAREQIDRMLELAGWAVQDKKREKNKRSETMLDITCCCE